MRALLILLICLPIPCLAQDVPVTLRLFDFEDGVSGWVANPWSGGKGFIEAAPQAKFGKGALRAQYRQVPEACNMISPYFAEDAPWRTRDFNALCFWLKGDGSKAYLDVHLESKVGDEAPVHTGVVPLDSTRWRRFCLKFDNLWNREGTPFELRHLARMYFGAGGSHDISIDQIQFQRPLRAVPLKPLDNPGPADVDLGLFADSEGGHYVTFDPQRVLEPTVQATLAVQWPGEQPQELIREVPAESATQETWLRLPGMADAEGAGLLVLQLRELDGERCYTGQFSYPVTMEAVSLELSDLQLIPQPKLMLQHPTKLKLPHDLAAYIISQPKIAQVGLDRVKGDMASCLGRKVSYNRKQMYDYRPAILIIAPEYERPTIPAEVSDRLPHLREQGYVLHVNDTEIVLAALDEAGMRNGAITLKQAIMTASPSAEEAVAPGLTVLDWPSLPIRAVNIGLPTARWGHPNDSPVSVDFFMDYLQRTVVDQKINCVGLEINQGMKFERHPEINGPAAWSKADVRRIVDFLRSNGIEVFPIQNSLGHANWLLIDLPEYREDGDENTLCTRHPRIRDLLTDVYDEIVEVFQPRYFHFGLDEIRWRTLDVAADKRCPRCAGADKRDLFVEHVKFLHGYAGSRNMRMLMWADMIIPEHNGGPPFNLADTVSKLPKDILMCDWSVTLAPLSPWELGQKGFTVWKCNSAGVNNAQWPAVAGNMWGIWSKVPWLTESCWPALEYSYLHQLLAAEYSWNVYPDLMADGVPMKPEFFRMRPLAQQRVAATWSASGAESASLEPGDKPLRLAGLEMRPWAEAVAAEKTFSVGKRVSAAYALLAAELPADQAAPFYDEFKKKDNWQGVPIGQIVLKYADGTEAAQPILYGYHVRAVTPEESFPQAMGAMATAIWPVGDRQKVAYLVQLPNPQPEQPVAEVRFVPGTLGARPLLLALATRGVWLPDE